MTPGVFLLWPPVRQHWGAMVDVIAEQFDVLRQHAVRFDDEGSFFAFVSDVYMRKRIAMDPAHREHSYLAVNRERVARIALHGFEFLAVIVHPKHGPLGPSCDYMKADLRRRFPVEPAAMNLNVHASDGDDEAAWMLNLLHPVSLAHCRLRSRFPPRPAFMDRLHALREWCLQRGIERHRICIVSGGVLEACGMRESRDLDIIVDDELRAELGPGGVKGDGIDIAAAGYHRSVTDQEIITSPRWHFSMLGLRFAHLRLVVETKRTAGRVKDRRDAELLAGPELAAALERVA